MTDRLATLTALRDRLRAGEQRFWAHVKRGDADACFAIKRELRALPLTKGEASQ